MIQEGEKIYAYQLLYTPEILDDVVSLASSFPSPVERNIRPSIIGDTDSSSIQHELRHVCRSSRNDDLVIGRDKPDLRNYLRWSSMALPFWLGIGAKYVACD